MTSVPSFADLSDRDLLVEMKRLAGAERRATAALLSSLAEIDARRLYLGEGCTSLFAYCTRILHLSEDAAYLRIEVARAARKFPVILGLLADGAVTLTAVSRVGRHLTAENHSQALESIRHKSKRHVQELVASLHPQPDVPAVVRKLPARQVAQPTVVPPMRTAGDVAVASTISAPSRIPAEAVTRVLPHAAGPNVVAPPFVATRPSVIAPLAPERYKVQFTVSRQTHDKLRRAQDLLRHAVPNGDPAEIFDRALTLLVQHLERTKLAAAKRPRRSTAPSGQFRHIPSDVKRAVWKRDDGQCGFVGTEGRCAERGFLEFHHVVPYAEGGRATIENIELRCRAHNQYHAQEAFGGGPLHVRQRAAPYVSVGPTRSGPIGGPFTSKRNESPIAPAMGNLHDDPICVPTFGATPERSNFVWTVARGHQTNDADRALFARAAQILAAYTERRVRYIGAGKPGAFALLRDWYCGGGRGPCSAANAR